MKTVINVSPRRNYFVMWQWCKDNFGREAFSKIFVYENDRWIFEDYYGGGNGFYAIFRDSEDATLFALTWL